MRCCLRSEFVSCKGSEPRRPPREGDHGAGPSHSGASIVERMTCKSRAVNVGISMVVQEMFEGGTAGSNTRQMDEASPRRAWTTAGAPSPALYWGHKP